MTVWSGNVAANEDDANERLDDTGFDATATTLRASDAAGTARWMFGIRFVTDIPAGSTISNATYTWTRSGSTTDSPQVDIFADDVDSSQNFSDGADLVNRTRTTASVSYTGTNLGATLQTSTDFATVVQELSDRGGWGGVITVLVIGKDQTAVEDYRCAALEHATITECALSVTYTAPAGGGGGVTSWIGMDSFGRRRRR